MPPEDLIVLRHRSFVARAARAPATLTSTPSAWIMKSGKVRSVRAERTRVCAVGGKHCRERISVALGLCFAILFSLYLCLSRSLSVSVSVSVCVSVSVSVCLFVCLSVCLSVSLLSAIFLFLNYNLAFSFSQFLLSLLRLTCPCKRPTRISTALRSANSLTYSGICAHFHITPVTPHIRSRLSALLSRDTKGARPSCSRMIF